MRIAAQILITPFLIVIFFVGLIAATFKFQLLNYNFWETSFQKNNVYQNLANVSKISFESQIDKEGGNRNDITFLTDLITPENVKDVVNRNLQYFLSFANGNATQINVYLPIEKVPANILPKNLSGLKSEIPLSELFVKFNFQGWQDLPLQDLSNMGRISTYIFAGSTFLFLILISFSILLVEKGKRFIALGIALLLSGCLTFLLTTIGTSLNTAISNNLMNNSSITATLAGVVFPPMAVEIMFIWKVLGLVILMVGICLFFVKKPTYNNSK